MLTEDREESKLQNWLILITPYFPVFELCWQSQELCGANFVSENLLKKNVQRYIHGNNYMTLMAHFTHCNVGDQAASVIAGRVYTPCLALERPCCVLSLSRLFQWGIHHCSWKPFQFSVYHSLFPDGEACFLQLCLTRLSHEITLPGSSPQCPVTCGPQRSDLDWGEENEACCQLKDFPLS